MPTRIGYRQPQVGNQGFARTVKTLGGAIALLATDAVTGNAVALLRVPKGFTATGVLLGLTDVDTNGTPTVLVTLGDATVANRLVVSSNIGQAGGTTSTLDAAGAYYTFLQDTDILLTFATGAATATAGTATCYLTGFMQ